MVEEIGKAGHITTSDGVRLHYVEAGAGKPVVMIPGWSQPAAQFKYQLAGLHDRYRLIAVDMRGHGESEKPDFGYKIARLSQDLHEVLIALDLHEVALLGHSMGCAVIWSYWELFGAERLARLVLVDCAPCLIANPVWSQAERETAGAAFTAEALYDIYNALAGPNGVEITKSLISSTVTTEVPPGKKGLVLNETMKIQSGLRLLRFFWRCFFVATTMPVEGRRRGRRTCAASNNCAERSRGAGMA